MLDEQALRRPGFTEGYKVALADGQEWTFPKARVVIAPRIAPDGSISVGGVHPYGDDYQRELETLLAGPTGSPEDGYLLTEAAIRMAAKLLLRNYALTSDQLAAVLHYDVEGSTAAMWEEIDRVIVGRAPKTLGRWLRLTLVANGVDAGREGLTVEDALDVAAMLVATGRAVPPAKWVAALAAEAEDAALGSFVRWG